MGQEQKSGRSFSATDYKGIEVKGTVVYEDAIRSFALVEDDDPAYGPVLWLVDTLEDVGVSLDVGQVRNLLPHMQRWADARAALSGGNK